MNKGKKRILFISSFGDFRGGGQRSLHLLLKGIERTRYIPLVVCPEEGDFVNELRTIGIMTFVLKFPSLRNFNLQKSICAVKKLKNLVCMANPDIVHTESSRSIIYLKLVLWKRKIPIVWHVRVSNSEPSLYELLLYYCSARIIAISHAVKKRFIRFPGAAKKIEVIYNAVEGTYANSGELIVGHMDYHEGLDTIVIGIVGRITPLKGHTTFVRAAAQVIEQGYKARFLIVGKGDQEYEEELRALIEQLGIQGSVIFTGYQEDVTKIMRTLDILVCASLEEAFSRVIIEAMAHAKPVIATQVGGIPEVVADGETGILVPPEDADELTQAIIKLSADKELRFNMGSCGEQRVKDMFLVENNVAKVQAVYAALA
ncbi:MAG: glycosyltransferase family 4 protein [Candidatus Omnitrophica bacterium]|nr:glycosyltransferase family 4 protein [Candidatus Omnitrophota bacterium]